MLWSLVDIFANVLELDEAEEKTQVFGDVKLSVDGKRSVCMIGVDMVCDWFSTDVVRWISELVGNSVDVTM